jgi:choline-sulfatase
MVDQLNGTLFPDGPADWLHAPNLKALAERSVRFSNAYTASPSARRGGRASCPASLPRRTRVYDNAAEFASDIPTFAHHLRRAGYQTCLSGKMHFVGPDQLHGFEERLTTDIYPADFGWTPDYRKPGERIDWWYHNMGSVTGAGVAEITNQMEYDDEVAFATQKLYDLARGKDDRPLVPDGQLHPSARPLRGAARVLGSLRGLRTLPDVAAIPYADHDPHSQRIFDANDWRSLRHHRGRHRPLAPRLFRQHLLSRRQDRRLLDVLEATRQEAIDRLRLRPRRHAGRARAVVQDELLRRLGARAADDRGARRSSRASTPRSRRSTSARRSAISPACRWRGHALDRRRKPAAADGGGETTAPVRWNTPPKARRRRWSPSARGKWKYTNCALGSRAVVRSRGRPGRAAQPRGRPGPCRHAGAIPRAGPPPAGTSSAFDAEVRDSQARRWPSTRRCATAITRGISSRCRSVRALHAQPHGPQRAGGKPALSPGRMTMDVQPKASHFVNGAPGGHRRRRDFADLPGDGRAARPRPCRDPAVVERPCPRPRRRRRNGPR